MAYRSYAIINFTFQKATEPLKRPETTGRRCPSSAWSFGKIFLVGDPTSSWRLQESSAPISTSSNIERILLCGKNCQGDLNDLKGPRAKTSLLRYQRGQRCVAICTVGAILIRVDKADMIVYNSRDNTEEDFESSTSIRRVQGESDRAEYLTMGDQVVTSWHARNGLLMPD